MRVAALARWVEDFAELKEVPCNRLAVHAAAWFQDAWCLEGVRKGQFQAALVLAMPPSDSQRDDAADLMMESLAGLLDDATLGAAAQAIRQCGARTTRSAEAQVLAEAANLDSIGPLWLCGQIARCSAEGRPVASLAAIWERQVEYGYWGKRIAETFRFRRSRDLARQRCEILEGFFLSLRRQLDGSDRHTAPETGR
jgi:hypothetical protein